MKKLILSLSLLAFIGSMSVFTSCEAIKKKAKEEAGVDLDFSFDGANATFDVPVITNLTMTTYPDTVEVPLELTSQLEAYSNLIGMGDVTSVTVTDMELVINNSDANNDASNFYTALAMMYSDSKPDPIVISTNDVVPDAPASTIELVPSPGINLLDYMKTVTKLYYFVGVNMRKPTDKVLNCTLKVKYRVQ